MLGFYIPKGYRWLDILSTTENLGEFLTDVTRKIARENPELGGIIDTIDFNQSISGHRTISDASLGALIQQLNRKKGGINDVDWDNKEDALYLNKYSPLNKVKNIKYPASLIYSRMNDDRVHPPHALKFYEKLKNNCSESHLLMDNGGLPGPISKSF